MLIKCGCMTRKLRLHNLVPQGCHSSGNLGNFFMEICGLWDPSKNAGVLFTVVKVARLITYFHESMIKLGQFRKHLYNWVVGLPSQDKFRLHYRECNSFQINACYYTN